MVYNSIILFLNLGGGEVMLLLLVVLLLFGSDQLPQLVKGVAKGIREINDAKNHIQNEIKNGTGEGVDDLKRQADALKNDLAQVQNTIKRSVGGATTVIQKEVDELGKDLEEKS